MTCNILTSHLITAPIKQETPTVAPTHIQHLCNKFRLEFDIVVCNESLNNVLCVILRQEETQFVGINVEPNNLQVLGNNKLS